MEDLGPPDQNCPEDCRRVARLDCQCHLRRSHLSRVRESRNKTRSIKRRTLTHEAPPYEVSHTVYVEQA
jgi:hypothetical protein